MSGKARRLRKKSKPVSLCGIRASVFDPVRVDAGRPYFSLYENIIITAGAFSFAPSVHKDITEKLHCVNRGLFMEAKEILDLNKSERHLRGGEATKIKYHKLKQDC